MKLEIDIPKEFEEHFDSDQFEDSLRRLSADAHLIAGNYEQELAIMLVKAFREAKRVRHGHWINGCYTAPIMPETDVCSECGLRLVYGLNFKYCPNCGAKMDEVGSNDC